MDDLEQMTRVAVEHARCGRHLDALQIYDKLIRAGDATPAVWCAAGTSLLRVREYAQARRAFTQCLARDEHADGGASSEAEHGLATAVFSLGDVDAAAELMQRVAERTGALASWLALATMVPGASNADNARIRAVRERFAAELARVTPEANIALRPTYRRAPGAPLRIGYLSAFFDRPNYMKPVWALINHHDRARFALHFFSDAVSGTVNNDASDGQDGAAREPAWEGYHAHASDAMHHTASLDNVALAALVRRCAIDVLVDLNGYSAPERLGLFLGHPAPVNVAWFNMYATSGLRGFDYIVGDAHVVPPAEDAHYTERVRRLPVSYLTFEVKHATPAVAPPPCTVRAQNNDGALTFGSLVSQYKITPATLDCWATILRETSQSRLLLANRVLGSAENRAYVQGQFAARGVATERIELRGPAEYQAFLRYYDEIDVALDAFPYNGGTTTMEALWQGVPVLTFAGDRWAARTSCTLLRNAGLADWVAPSANAMVARAVALVRDPATLARLRELRHAMRERLAASAACDGAALASAFEDLLQM